MCLAQHFDRLDLENQPPLDENVNLKCHAEGVAIEFDWNRNLTLSSQSPLLKPSGKHRLIYCFKQARTKLPMNTNSFVDHNRGNLVNRETHSLRSLLLCVPCAKQYLKTLPARPAP